MKKNQRFIALLLVLAFTASLVLSSCRMFRGDPRKNCNHPEHGKYMQTVHKKKTGF
ncbi:MAG: hypothetical protein AAF587_21550 [Bacteroidota bacterium]